MPTNKTADIIVSDEATATAANTSTIKRTVGVEIECIMQDDYSHSTIEHSFYGVQVGGDGSIDGNGDGIEVKTPPLAGAEAEACIQNVCAVLNDYDARVNTSTGMHVHVDAREVSINKCVRWYDGGSSTLRDGEKVYYIHRAAFTNGYNEDAEIFADVVNLIETSHTVEAVGAHGNGYVLETHSAISTRLPRSAATGEYVIPDDKQREYYVFAVNTKHALGIRHRLYNAMRFFSAVDPILRSLVPSSRRHNTYCQPFEKIARSGGRCPSTLKELLEGVSQRYCGINLKALDSHGTIECRYHGGTVNGDKIVHWARLFERIVDTALSGAAEHEADALAEVVNGKNRLDMLLALLALPESTEKYLKERHSAFTGSDARHAIAYINNKMSRRAAVTN